MNWNTIYHTYEGIAILLMVTCFGGIIGNSATHHTQDTQHLYETLEKAKNMVSLNNDHPTIMKFIKDVSQEDKGYQYVPRFQQIRRLANQVMAFLEQHKKYLAKHPMNTTQPVTQYMLKKRKGYDIQQTLNDYVNALNEDYKDILGYKLSKIALGNKNLPLYQQSWWFVEKDFAHLNFENTTVAEALTVITQKQMVVSFYAKEIIRRLESRPFWYTCAFKSLMVGVSSIRNHIPVGDSLDMQIFAGESLYPRRNSWYYIEINGQKRRIGNGFIPVNFTVTGKGKKYWGGKISYCEEGVEHTKTFKVPYWVK